MQTTIPLYGFGGGSGGTGATLTVTAPAGATVTVSKDGKTKTRVADSSGVAVFKGLATGTWTVTITNGEQTAQKTVTITADYSTAITFFAATIHVTYPAGSTCTATDGVTTLTAPDTGGTWDCVVPNAGTWTVSLDNWFAETVNVTTSDVMYTVDEWNLYNAGNQYTSITGGWVGTHANSSYTASGGYLTVNNDNLEVKNVGGGSFSAATKNTVDLSKFNTLHVIYTGTAYVCVAGTFPTSSYSAQAEGSVASSKTEITVDISSLTGAYRIAIIDAHAATINVYKVWMT